MGSSLRWGKGFRGCAIITEALEQEGQLPDTEVRQLLVEARFNNNEIAAVFEFLRRRNIVSTTNNVWTLSGLKFNTR